MEELFFLVAKKTPDAPLQVCGCVTRTMAHALGFPHTTVLLVPATWDQEQEGPVLFVHKRSPHKRTCPNTWDFCGGHLSFRDWHCHCLQNSLNMLDLIERTAEQTALREANEELRCNPSFEFRPKDIRLFKSVGYFDCETKSERSHNVEYSTAYVVTVPQDRSVSVWDTDKEGERPLDVRRASLEGLLGEFKEAPTSFADGAARILRRLGEDSSLESEFRQLLANSTEQMKSTNDD